VELGGIEWWNPTHEAEKDSVRYQLSEASGLTNHVANFGVCKWASTVYDFEQRCYVSIWRGEWEEAWKRRGIGQLPEDGE